MTSNILRIENLSKHFRSDWAFKPIKAVDNISFEVKQGESFGFLGSNGAGKTTTIKCILGLVNITSGKVFFEDKELCSTKTRANFGFLPEHPYFYEHLSVEETLLFLGSLHGIDKVKRKKLVPETIEKVGLEGRAKSKVKSLSKGLQQRVGVAQAIINKPKILFLDEPFSGLDPNGRKQIREIIGDLNREGTTIFISSHILSDVEHLCSRVSIMKKGQIELVFELAETEKMFGHSYRLTVADLEENFASCPKMHEVCIRTEKNGRLSSFIFAEYEHAISAQKKFLEANKKIVSFQDEKPNLEEIFVKITE